MLQMKCHKHNVRLPAPPQIDQMKMSNTVGILFVDSKQMRAALQHLVVVAIEDIKTVRAFAHARSLHVKPWAFCCGQQAECTALQHLVLVPIEDIETVGVNAHTGPGIRHSYCLPTPPCCVQLCRCSHPLRARTATLSWIR